MKILMVNKFLYPNGGSETYIFKIGEKLRELGHQVEYFGMEHPDRCVGNSLNLYTENMDFHNSSAVDKVKMSLKTVYSKEARDKMLAVLKDFQPDVVHLNNFNFQLTPSIIYAVDDYKKETGRNVKLIYTAHDYQLVCPNHMMRNLDAHENCDKCLGGKYINCTKGKCIHSSALKSLLGSAEGYIYNKKNTYKKIDKIICCSAFMEKALENNPNLNGRTTVLHNFVDKEIPENTEKKDYVLYFGRFDEEKGIDTICQCAKRLPDVKFIFAGKGSKEDFINSIDNIENVGFKTGEDLDRLISEAAFTVYPSLWYENCPFSVLESISLGTPVIGANIGGIPELIDDGRTGMLFEAGNADDLTAKISKAFEDKELCRKMAENCKENSFLSLDEYTEKYLEIIN
ncbi:MAG: glycosyltransferase [Eubacteriales bacterium]|nr:glycosyltransferase [Eubacteriales bacterium]